MCIIIMCADHNVLCIGPVFKCNTMYLDLLFLVSIVSGPDFGTFFGCEVILG